MIVKIAALRLRLSPACSLPLLDHSSTNTLHYQDVPLSMFIIGVGQTGLNTCKNSDLITDSNRVRVSEESTELSSDNSQINNQPVEDLCLQNTTVSEGCAYTTVTQQIEETCVDSNTTSRRDLWIHNSTTAVRRANSYREARAQLSRGGIRITRDNSLEVILSYLEITRDNSLDVILGCIVLGLKYHIPITIILTTDRHINILVITIYYNLVIDLNIYCFTQVIYFDILTLFHCLIGINIGSSKFTLTIFLQICLAAERTATSILQGST